MVKFVKHSGFLSLLPNLEEPGLSETFLFYFI